MIGKDGPSKSMGMKFSEKRKEQAPGPGQYEMRKTVGEGPKWAMGSEMRTIERDDGVPGPGQYVAETEKGKGPSWGMGTSRRTEMRSSDAPGPGGYNPKRSPEGPHYSMLGKGAKSKRHDSPGPGQYNPASEKTKQSAPGYKIGTEAKGKMKRKDGPGPGQYEVRAEKETIAYGFRSGQRA